MDIIDIANRHNLSKIEKIMLAYDLSFDNYFSQNNNINDNFTEYLDNLNIKSYPFSVTDNQGKSHKRFAIYVKDSKYKLNGVYFFDLVKAYKEGYELYDSFGKSKLYFDEYDKKNGYTENYIGNFADIADIFYDIAQFDSYDEVPNKYIDSINNLSFIINGQSLNLPYNDPDKKLDYYEIYKMINKFDIDLHKDMYFEHIIKMILKVNKVKYLEELTNTIDINYLKYVLTYSNWTFNPKSRYELNRKREYNKLMDKDFYHKKPIFQLVNKKGLIRSNLDYYKLRIFNLSKASDMTIEKMFNYYMSKDPFYRELLVLDNCKVKKCN